MDAPLLPRKRRSPSLAHSTSTTTNQGSRRCAAERCSACEPRRGPIFTRCAILIRMAQQRCTGFNSLAHGCPLLPGNRHSPSPAHSISTTVNQGSRRCAAERCSACEPRHGPMYPLCTMNGTVASFVRAHVAGAGPSPVVSVAWGVVQCTNGGG